MNHPVSSLSNQDQLLLFSACLSHVTDMIIITSIPEHTNQAPQILFTNGNFNDFTGYSSSEILGKSPAILQGKDTNPQTRADIKQAISDRVGIKTEILNYKKNGEPYWIELNLTPICLGSNKATHFLGISTDITEAKRTREVLREKEESLGFVLDVTDVGYWDLDLQKNQTSRSLKHDQLFGYGTKQVEWTYETFLSHVHLSDRAKVAKAYEKAMQEASDYDVEFKCVWPSGEVKWLWSKGRFIQNAKGEVVRAAGIQVDITDKKLAEQEINRLAFIDSLTGLPNKAQFYNTLRYKVAESTRNNDFAALLFIDIDNFKSINDTLGHEIGDQLLVKIAEKLSKNLRGVDSIARFGGDEFVIIAGGLGKTSADAKHKVNTIYKKLSLLFEEQFFIDNHTLFITPSIGARLFVGDSSSVSDILKQADMAMYQAKADGKNRLRYFDSAMQDDLNNRLDVEQELREILTSDQLSVHYQPKINRHNQLIGFEALLRWMHPVKGNVSPMVFIPIAEESGAIVPIGNWVLNTVCDDIVKWSKIYPDMALTFSVNISAVQFAHPEIAEQIMHANEKIAHCRSKLMLEITEQTLISNLEQSVEILELLLKQNIAVSLDDFGTGYSSLYYLKVLPIHEVKIDRSFIRDILVDENDAAIVSAVLGIAEKLNLTVVAEGVETQAQHLILSGMGCNIFQGYWHKKPMPANETQNYLGLTDHQYQ